MNIIRVHSDQFNSEAQKKINDLVAIDNNKGKCILTKGVFDIIHFGHLALFNYLGALKEKMKLSVIVALSSDKLVKSKKGESRPINPQNQRALQLALLPQIDYVLVNDETDYSNIIEKLEPVVYVKGMDTAGPVNEDLIIKNPEFSLMPSNSEVVIFCDNGQISTSEIIRRINKMNN